MKKDTGKEKQIERKIQRDIFAQDPFAE